VVEQGPAALRGRAVFAFHPHQDRFVVPAGDAIVLAAGQDPRLATLLPLVETALQLSLDAGPVWQEPVVVLGLGAVGLLSALLLARAGGRVLAADPLEWRRSLAAEVGVVAVPPAELVERVASISSGAGVPLVLEASGNPAALAGALDLLAHEGTALVASWYGTKPVTLPLGGAFHRRRLTIRSSQVSTIPAAASGRWSIERRRRAARDLLGELPLEALATDEWPLSEAKEAYRALADRRDGLLHAALRYVPESHPAPRLT
jgi:threonine dehydrogenase-like Zn-dependent dehydrogenase